MVRANALHYALRIRTLLSTMQRFGVLRERQTHMTQTNGRASGRATTLLAGKKIQEDGRAGRRGWRGGRRDHEQYHQRGGKEVRARLCDLCLAHS